MSTSYYMRLKDDKKLDTMRRILEETETMVNLILERTAERLYDIVTNDTNPIIDKDNFNKQFCNSAGWYGGYPDEQEDYHLRRICLSEIEHIQVEIGTYSSGKFNWKLMSVNEGYYDVQRVDEGRAYDGWLELKEYSFPRDKAQFKEFMKKYKDKVEIVDEYHEAYTLTQFLKKVDEY